MTFGELLASPWTWVIYGICFLAGWYAKNSLVDAIIFSWIAPLILVPTWWLASIALTIPYVVLLEVTPSLIKNAEALYSSLPDPLAFALLPSTILTTTLLIIYCQTERVNGPLPRTGLISSRSSDCANPLRKRI